MRRNQRGFTLIELTIAIVLIGIIASMAVIKFVNLSQTGADTQKKAALHTVYTAISVATADLGRYSTLGELVGSSHYGGDYLGPFKPKVYGTGPGYISGSNFINASYYYSALIFKFDGKYSYIKTFKDSAGHGTTSMTDTVVSVDPAFTDCPDPTKTC